MSGAVPIAIYSDYLCPWCYVATIRLRKIKEEYGDGVSIVWKSYTIRRGTGVTGFLAHTNQGRFRAGEEEEGLVFRPWPEDRPMPATSLPAQEAAKCAALQGPEVFERLHLLLLRAYCTECQDISQRDVLIALAKEAGLDLERFIPAFDSGSQRERVVDEYQECLEKYAGWGIPTAVFGEDIVLAGAVPVDMYRRAISAARRQLRY